MRQPAMVCFDNLPDGYNLDSPELARIVTIPMYEGRLLGLSKVIRFRPTRSSPSPATASRQRRPNAPDHQGRPAGEGGAPRAAQYEHQTWFDTCRAFASR